MEVSVCSGRHRQVAAAAVRSASIAPSAVSRAPQASASRRGVAPRTAVDVASERFACLGSRQTTVGFVARSARCVRLVRTASRHRWAEGRAPRWSPRVDRAIAQVVVRPRGSATLESPTRRAVSRGPDATTASRWEPCASPTWALLVASVRRSRVADRAIAPDVVRGTLACPAARSTTPAGSGGSLVTIASRGARFARVASARRSIRPAARGRARGAAMQVGNASRDLSTSSAGRGGPPVRTVHRQEPHATRPPLRGHAPRRRTNVRPPTPGAPRGPRCQARRCSTCVASATSQTLLRRAAKGRTLRHARRSWRSRRR